MLFWSFRGVQIKVLNYFLWDFFSFSLQFFATQFSASVCHIERLFSFGLDLFSAMIIFAYLNFSLDSIAVSTFNNHCCMYFLAYDLPGATLNGFNVCSEGHKLSLRFFFSKSYSCKSKRKMTLTFAFQNTLFGFFLSNSINFLGLHILNISYI